MSLLGLSAAAVAGARAGKRCSAGAAADDHQAAHASALQLNLQQLAASVAACKQSAAQTTEQGCTDPVTAVQEGLRVTQGQLARLLQQQQQHPQQQQQEEEEDGQQQQQQQVEAQQQRHLGSNDSQPAQGASIWVLKHLLQLAVGDSAAAGRSIQPLPTCSAANHTDAASPAQQQSRGQTEPAQDAWYPLRLPNSASQQQQWGTAALSAVQLFSLQDLLGASSNRSSSSGLDHNAWHQAMLLQPQLLDEMLEAVAAAVLPAEMPAGHQLDEVHCPQASYSADSSAAQQTAENSSSSSGSSIAALLASSKLPWQQLPAILAASPLLMLQASGTLLGWLAATGHQRLWQLASITLRPAWIAMAAAAAAAAARDAAAAEHPKPGEEMHSQQQQQQQQKHSNSQLALAGSFHLLCPEPWQQQLVHLVVQQPSLQGLAQLLQLLPGMQSEELQLLQLPVSGKSAASQQQQQQQQGSVGGGTSNSDALNSSQLLFTDRAWPTEEEWQQEWHYCSTNKQQHFRCSAVAAGNDMLAVLSAWRLVVQHRCWYEFACHLLVHSSMAVLQKQQQQGQQASKQGIDHSNRSSTVQLAGHAAAFIAWVQQPADAVRRRQLQQLLLLSPTTTASSCTAHDAAATSSSCGAGTSTSSLQQAQCLLQAWRVALLDNTRQRQRQRQQQQQPIAPITAVAAGLHGCLQQQTGCHAAATHNSGRCESLGFAAAACLAEIDLPLAAMQQLELLLGCKAQQLLQLCFPGLLSHLHHQQQQQQQQRDDQEEEDQHLRSSPAPQATQKAAVWKTLCSTQPAAGAAAAAAAAAPVLCAVADALESMASAGVELLTTSLKTDVHLAAAQQQQQGEVVQHVACSHWLAQQWLAAAIANSEAGSVREGQQGVGCVYDVTGSVAQLPAVAKKLLLAVTGCIELLRKE